MVGNSRSSIYSGMMENGRKSVDIVALLLQAEAENPDQNDSEKI